LQWSQFKVVFMTAFWLVFCAKAVFEIKNKANNTIVDFNKFFI